LTFTSPELRQQPRLLAVIGGTNRAAEQDEAAVSLAGAEHLSRVPRERSAVERNEHQTGFRTGDQ
jgi:hypothetical protein